MGSSSFPNMPRSRWSYGDEPLKMLNRAFRRERLFRSIPKKSPIQFALVGIMSKNFCSDTYHATTTLSYERFLLANSARTELFFEDMLTLARRHAEQGLVATSDPVLRQKIAQLLFFRNLTTELRGDIAGPEASIMKLYSTELNHRICGTAMELMGPYAGLWQDSDYVVDDGMRHYEHMFTLGLIIGGGTSQIQKNIIAERALGLPK